MPRRGHPGAAAGRPLPGALPITIRRLSKMLLSRKIVSNRAKGFRASRYQVPVVPPPCLWRPKTRACFHLSQHYRTVYGSSSTPRPSRSF